MKNNYWALKLVLVLIVVFVLQSVFKPAFTNLFVLQSREVLVRPWILITSIFLHGNLAHLLVNGLGLALFGSILENIIGSKRFLWIFFVSGLGASIASSFFYEATLGASGAIFGVMGTLTYLRPGMTIWLNFMPMPLWLASIYWAIENVVGILIPDNIANLAHVSGLFFGLALGFFIKEKQDKIKKEIAKKDSIMMTKEELENWEDKFFK